MANKIVIVEVPSGAGSGLARREMFTNASDISSSTESGLIPDDKYNEMLGFRGTDDLNQNKDISAFEGQLDTARTFAYMEDYYIGDIVQISTGSNESKVRISEVVTSNSASGLDVYLTVETVE